MRIRGKIGKNLGVSLSRGRLNRHYAVLFGPSHILNIDDMGRSGAISSRMIDPHVPPFYKGTAAPRRRLYQLRQLPFSPYMGIHFRTYPKRNRSLLDRKFQSYRWADLPKVSNPDAESPRRQFYRRVVRCLFYRHSAATEGGIDAVTPLFSLTSRVSSVYIQ